MVCLWIFKKMSNSYNACLLQILMKLKTKVCFQVSLFNFAIDLYKTHTESW